MQSKKIGELNGPWAILLRAGLATYPMVVMLLVWIVKSIFELQAANSQGDRFTLQDAYALERRIDARFDQLPPADWREKIEALGRENLRIRDSMKNLENEFTRDFVRKDELGN